MAEKKKKMTNPTSSPSLSSLPDEIVVHCLARVSKSYYGSLCLVSKSFYSLLSSPDIYAARSELGATESRVYLFMWSPNDRRLFTLSAFNKGELSLVPVKLSSSSYSCYARLTATTVAVGSQIYQIGGAIMQKRSKALAKRCKSVIVFDCRSNTWQRGPNMIVGRKNAKSCFLDGKIYVIGGCSNTDKEEPMNCGEVFDLKTQTWKPLPSPSNEILDPNHNVVAFEGRLYVSTKNNNKYAYDPEEGRWVLPEMDLEPISSLSRSWCVIENVMFGFHCGKIKWYNPRCGKWYIVNGLHDLSSNRQLVNHGGKLVNHGGKLVIIWYEWIMTQDGPNQNKKIWCAVIKLEKQPNHQFCGEVERCNAVLTVSKFHKLPSCLSISV